MEYYKTKRIIDGNPLKWVIVDENGKIVNRNPSENELKILKVKPRLTYTRNKKYNETNTCDKCKEKDIETKLIPRRTFRDYNENGEWSGKWLCKSCHDKRRTKCRNKQLSKNSNTGKGFIGEQIWCKWRGNKNCNIVRDNFHSKEDTIDSEYGIIQVKLAVLINGKWDASIQNYDFDTAVILFMDSIMKNIEKMCIIPVKEFDIKHIQIKKDNEYSSYSKSEIMCNKFYVSQDVCDEINEVYHNMSLTDCPILKKE